MPKMQKIHKKHTMKKNITISVEYENYLSAKEKIDNISAYLDKCLESVSKKEIDTNISTIKEQLAELDKTLTEGHIKKALLQTELQREADNKALKAKQMLEDEQYMRWKCGVCKTVNFMEQERCSKCALPTRKDPKTEIVSIKGGVAE